MRFLLPPLALHRSCPETLKMVLGPPATREHSWLCFPEAQQQKTRGYGRIMFGSLSGPVPVDGSWLLKLPASSARALSRLHVSQESLDPFNLPEGSICRKNRDHKSEIVTSLGTG